MSQSQIKIRIIEIEKLNFINDDMYKNFQVNNIAYDQSLISETYEHTDLIIWNERTGNIISGHQRLKILKQLGYTEIQCVVVNLDEYLEKALNIAFSKINVKPNIPLLCELMYNLDKDNFNMKTTDFFDM